MGFVRSLYTCLAVVLPWGRSEEKKKALKFHVFSSDSAYTHLIATRATFSDSCTPLARLPCLPVVSCAMASLHRDCLACGNHCFASRTECNRCGTPKPPGEGGLGGREGGYQGGGFSGGYGGSYGGGYGGGGYNKRPGDW